MELASKGQAKLDVIGAAGLGNSGKRQGEASDCINKGEGATTNALFGLPSCTIERAYKIDERLDVYNIRSSYCLFCCTVVLLYGLREVIHHEPLAGD